MTAPALNQAQFDLHDPTCASLQHFKFFRKGGVCCMSCYDTCTDCLAPFWTDTHPAPPALTFVEDGHIDEDGDVVDLRLCDCCNRRRAENPSPDQNSPQIS